MDSQQIPQQINSAIERAKHFKWAVWLFAGLFAISGGIFAYNHFANVSNMAVENYQAAQPAKGMDNPPTELVKPTAPLKAYDKQRAARKMELPAEITENPKTALLQTAKIPPSEGGHTAAAVLDTGTGGTQLIIKEEPRPLFAFGGKTAIGVVAGISTRGNMAILYAKQDVIRIGPVKIGAAAGGGTLGNDGVLGAGIHIHGEF